MYVADEVGRVRENNRQKKSERAGQEGRDQLLRLDFHRSPGSGFPPQ